MARKYSRGENANLWIIVLAVVLAFAALAAFFVQRSAGRPNQPAGLPVVSQPEGSSSSQAEQSSSQPEQEPEQSQPEAQRPVIGGSSSQAEQPKPDKLSITESGDYTEEESLRQVVIRSGEVTLANKTISGDLFIMDEVYGDVRLENISVAGTIYVYGSDLLEMDSVTAPTVRLQRDNLPLSVLLKGQSRIENTLLMCSATLRERGLGKSEGFVNMQVENGGLLIKNNITLLSVHLDQLTVNYNSRINLSSGTEIKQADANAKLALEGLGRVKDLVVRNDYVQYAVDPDNITVKRGYEPPVKTEQQYAADEDGEAYSLLDNEAIQLDTPSEVELYVEDGFLMLEYSHVAANDGYYVVVYMGSQRFKSIYTDVDEESLQIAELAEEQDGKRFYAKVKALGSVYDSTEDSEFGDSESIRYHAEKAV